MVKHNQTNKHTYW